MKIYISSITSTYSLNLVLDWTCRLKRHFCVALTDQSHLGQVKRGRCHSAEIRFCRAPYTDPGAPSREREHCPVCHEAGTRSEVPPAPQSNKHCALASSHTPVHLWWVELRPPSISQHAVPDTQRAGTKELFVFVWFCVVLQNCLVPKNWQGFLSAHCRLLKVAKVLFMW